MLQFCRRRYRSERKDREFLRRLRGETKFESLAALQEQIAKDIENEATIENLIKAKGFDECVAIISEGNCSVVVSITEPSLAANQIAQIKEIVIDTAGIVPSAIKIISRTVST